MVCTNPSGHIFQVLNHADDCVEWADITGFQQVKEQICRGPIDGLSLLLR